MKHYCLGLVIIFAFSFFASWLPGKIFDSEEVAKCGLFIAGFGAIFGVQKADKEGFFKHFYVTLAWWYTLLLYLVAALISIGFRDVTFLDMKALGKAIVYFAALPLISFLVESFIIDSRKKEEQE